LLGKKDAMKILIAQRKTFLGEVEAEIIHKMGKKNTKCTRYVQWEGKMKKQK
jgi:hypothetical protein